MKKNREKNNTKGILYIEGIIFKQIKNFKYDLKPNHRYVENQKMLAKLIANKIQDEYNKAIIQVKGLDKKQKIWENMIFGEKTNPAANIFLWGGLSVIGIAVVISLIYIFFF